MRPRTDPIPTPRPGLIAGVYLAVSAAWILLSDALLAAPPGAPRWIQTAKGLGFVVVTGVLLFVVLTVYRRRVEGAARAIAESEARFRQLAENVREVFWLTDAETSEVLYVSPAYEEIWGDSRDRLVGSPGRWIDSVHPEDRRRVLAALSGQVHGEYDLVYRIVRDDGEARWIRDRAFPVRDEGGRVRRIAGLAEDVTEHRAIEEGLRETRDTLQAVIDATPAAIVSLDIEGRVTLWNPASERIFGFTAEEVVGQLPPFIPPEAREEHRELLDRALAGERHEGIEIVRRRKDGEEIDLLLYTAPTYGWNGEITGVAAALLDVTQRKGLEEQLRQAAKMEAIGRLAGGIAHDFNNLLTAIGGYAELLLTESEPPKEWIAEIQGAAGQAGRLTSQLLSFSRRQVVQPAVLDLASVVRELEAILERLIGERIHLEIGLEEGMGSVIVDRGQLEQVIVNLVVNARDAMPEGGTIRIESDETEIDDDEAGERRLEEPGAYVRLRVIDTGAGMDARTVDRAFEPFFTTKERGKGTGLGLATVYGIARQAGGDARIQSEPGTGTTVEVLLPLGPERVEPEAVEPRPASAALGGSERILIVEDDDRVRRLAARILVANGYTVRTAGSVEEGRAAAGEQPIDLLLSDVVLPDGAGPELVADLRAGRPGLPVVYMSGYADFDFFHGSTTMEETGDIDGAFLQKPFTALDLAARVRETLDAG